MSALSVSCSSKVCPDIIKTHPGSITIGTCYHSGILHQVCHVHVTVHTTPSFESILILMAVDGDVVQDGSELCMDILDSESEHLSVNEGIRER